MHKVQAQLDKAEHLLSEKNTEGAISNASAEVAARDISALRGELKAHADAAAKVGSDILCLAIHVHFPESTRSYQGSINPPVVESVDGEAARADAAARNRHAALGIAESSALTDSNFSMNACCILEVMPAMRTHNITILCMGKSVPLK